MDELYVESFFRRKQSPSVEQEVLAAPLPPKADPDSPLSLLKRELHKHFPNSYPVQKFLKQVEEGLATSNRENVLSALDKLEEWVEIH